ncbi:hypothetical protein [Streptomyces spongiae]|uniref:Type A2 lantipeptide n=1 Tax=Streptomyces spongiae TaxID=565072 RepID=A0A5N8XAZ4_9ACTN|nr:hypothetical protein [Streptomyces spongiae]MPY56612.1 hypothetical protein [Streptomyces spongiae]
MIVTPQVATAEMSDADLDTVSGGLAGGVSGGLFLETPLADVCADLLAVASPEGLGAGGSVQATAAH